MCRSPMMLTPQQENGRLQSCPKDSKHRAIHLAAYWPGACLFLVSAIWIMAMLDVVDVSGLRGRDRDAVARIGAEVGRACRDVGFFYIRNHGVPDTLLSDIFKSSQAFFAAPAAEKAELSISRSKHNRGYVGMATERLDPSNTDFKEAFNVGLDLPASDPEV